MLRVFVEKTIETVITLSHTVSVTGLDMQHNHFCVFKMYAVENMLDGNAWREDRVITTLEGVSSSLVVGGKKSANQS